MAICYNCGDDRQLVEYSTYCQRCYDAWERLQEADAEHIFGPSAVVGRPRQYASNAERQKAYRQRAKEQKALRNSVKTIQAELNAHNERYNPNDSSWIDRSTQLFDNLMAARRRQLRDEQR